jgi:hypothetical protein
MTEPGGQVRTITLNVAMACLLPLAAVSCGGSGAGDGIVGKWQTGAGADNLTLEFHKDGKLDLTGNPGALAFAFPFAKVMNDFRVAPHAVPLSYKLPDARKLEIAADLSKLLAGLAGDKADVKGGIVVDSADIAMGRDEMTIRNGDKRVTFKRAK